MGPAEAVGPPGDAVVAQGSAKHATPAAPADPEIVVNTRAGGVLLKKTILKSDHFPGCQNTTLRPLLDGAPNFRQVEGLPVYGVAMPTVHGLRVVLDRLGSWRGKPVLWHNMREEPVLYINGKPYVVRDVENPFGNLEYTGINRQRVEDMERRLKADVLAEAQQYEGNILIASETDDFKVIDIWEQVSEEDVQTPLEVYAELIAEGYNVDYIRIPVTDEKAPKPSDCDQLIERLWDVPENAALMFNCQMGRGRTTTGMIIASLVFLRRRHHLPLPEGQDPPGPPLGATPGWLGSAAVGASPKCAASSPKGTVASRLAKGEYPAVRSLLRVLPHALHAKAVLDSVVDACSAMQNLREAIGRYRGRIEGTRKEAARGALLAVAVEYLERYYVLVGLTAYILGSSFGPAGARPDHVAFEGWMKGQPELRSVLERLLRRNPLTALELNTLGTGAPEEMEEARAEAGEEQADVEAEKLADFIADRAGDVLNSGTVLKADHFPALPARDVPQLIEGAPNFRRVAGQPIYGTSIPTIPGIRAVLENVGCAPDACGDTTCVWHNLREEVMVYINGRPFVLRESIAPYKNMVEYDGIDVGRLEAMETRLKADVLAEAASSFGWLLVMEERDVTEDEIAFPQADDEASGPKLISEWIRLDGVMTPREAYESLAAEGYKVAYHRVPITDGAAPTPEEVDAVASKIMPAAPLDPIVFNCQLGRGRTTVGMVLALLLATYRLGPFDLPQRAESIDLSEHPVYGTSPIVSDEEEDDEEITSSSPRAASALGADIVLWPRVEGHEDPEDVAARAGNYQAVRRLCALLPRGDDIKTVVDAAVDASGRLVNLRGIIRSFRKPRRSFRFYRPETQARVTAFKRGCAYLERYCGLLQFAAYLEARQDTVETKVAPTFSEWLTKQPALGAVINSIRTSPMTSLEVVLPSFPAGPFNLSVANTVEDAELDTRRVAAVLSRRRGTTLNPRTILKSFHAPDMFNPNPALEIRGISDLRQAHTFPVLTTANPSLGGLLRLLNHLGAGPGGSAHVVLTDTREETVVYIGGSPYSRRDVDEPVTNTHHAGIHWRQLQHLEEELSKDARAEVSRHGGSLLLHRELPPELAASAVEAKSGSAVLWAGTGGSDSPAGSPLKQPDPISGRDPRAQVLRRESAHGLLHDSDPVPLDHVAYDRGANRRIDAAQLVPFWERVGDEDGPLSEGIASPLQVVRDLQAKGYSISYRRIPLSRERTPKPYDVDYLWEQAATTCPSGRKQLLHLAIDRTATGSSMRFVCALLCMFLRWRGAQEGAPIVDRQRKFRRSADPTTSFENKTIANLCRALPGGVTFKLDVDRAVADCKHIGCITDDIAVCHRKAEHNAATAQFAADNIAARLGLHYLKRYFFLVAFRAFLDEYGTSHTPFGEHLFDTWIKERKEMKHLLDHMSL